MILTGVLVNTLAVLAAGLLGSLCRKGVSESLRTAVMSGLGLCSAPHLTVSDGR